MLSGKIKTAIMTAILDDDMYGITFIRFNVILVSIRADYSVFIIDKNNMFINPIIIACHDVYAIL